MSFADWAMLDGSHWARVRTTFIVDQGMCAFAGVAVKQPDGAVCEASSNVVDIFRIFAAHYVFGSITVDFLLHVIKNLPERQGSNCVDELSYISSVDDNDED